MHNVPSRRAISNLNLGIAPLTSPRFQRSFHVSSSTHHAARTYNEAIDALNSLQTPFEVVEARRKAGIKPGPGSVTEMTAYLNRIGYQLSDLNQLNVIHVAGTKGKGSTCAYVDSILTQYRRKHPSILSKTGLYISPHLVAVRERIRINGSPISEALFAKYFFDVWDRLDASKATAGTDSSADTKPSYARYLTLMSWHVFMQERVDAAVYETGIGGEYDATNLIPRPVASGITTLGIDHTFALGDTIDKIAWHKAGIMKHGSPAFTVPQEDLAMKILRERATEKDVKLTELGIHPSMEDINIRPKATFQQKNATLAVALAEATLRSLNLLPAESKHEASLPSEFIDGLEKCVFRGRSEVKDEEAITWHVDGAHTADSLTVASQWFAQEASEKPGPRVLIFNQQGRTEAVHFLDLVFTNAKASGRTAPFDHVIFCTNVTYAKSGYKRDFVNNQFDPKDIGSMKVQEAFAKRWLELDPACKVTTMPTIEQAIDSVRDIRDSSKSPDKTQVFITGSLHLVGGALGILDEADAL